MSFHFDSIEENLKKLQIHSEKDGEQNFNLKELFLENENTEDLVKNLAADFESSHLACDDYKITYDLDFHKQHIDSLHMQNAECSTAVCQSKNKNHKWIKKTCEELLEASMEELSKMKEDLSSITEGVSAELVNLLQERHDLQEEVNLRNVAIEQLLKLQEKFQWRLTMPFTVQMSVIQPEEKTDVLRCN